MADGYFRGFDALRFPEAYASIEKADVERFLREKPDGQPPRHLHHRTQERRITIP